MKLTQIDAFTAEPFSGNPAAVCLLDAYPEDSVLQALALELNLSETAFLVRNNSGYELRWFTPRVEVDLCGHATLASAHHLWESGELPVSAAARFHTRSGELVATRDDGWIEMDFPSQPPSACEPPPELLEALGVAPIWVGRNSSDWLLEVASEEEVRDLAPAMQQLSHIEGRGFVVTAVAGSGDFHFVSRFFAPAVGVDEDPVTGSAHCCLGPYWAERLGRKELVGYQASPRGGIVRVRPVGDRVRLAGQAVTVLEARLLVEWP